MSRTGRTKSGREYDVAYAVVRVDYDMPNSFEKESDYEGPGIYAGTHTVTVKEVVTTVEEAKSETRRLNGLAEGRNCRYFWQGTHLFRDGASHGSDANRRGAE